MFIRGMIEFIKEIGKDDVCTKISLKIRKFWPGDEKINRKRKFRAAFDYYKCRSNQSNTRSSSQDRHDFLDDSKVKRQDIRESIQPRNYPVYTDLFEDYTAHIPKLSTDLFNKRTYFQKEPLSPAPLSIYSRRKILQSNPAGG